MMLSNWSDNWTDYEHYDYSMYDEIPSIPLDELLAPLLVYSVTYCTGLLGNILILVAVTGQKQVSPELINNIICYSLYIYYYAIYAIYDNYYA